MKQCYIDKNFSTEIRALIESINVMIARYQAQGFMLSVRQLYYQLVARGVIENTERSYKRIASVINDGRLAGLIDWDAIEDRGRDIELFQRWDSGQHILKATVGGFHMDHWDNQDTRVFVIVEKAALAGVLGGVCRKWDVPLLAARGYPSVSIVREFVMDHILPAANAGQNTVILHLGDHDPSGIDMTRDLRERIQLFAEADAFGNTEADISRIALTMRQIEAKRPPPNPAKTTDSRFEGYLREFGSESWELDALEPAFLVNLVETEISAYVDEERWDERSATIEEVRVKLQTTADTFDA